MECQVGANFCLFSSFGLVSFGLVVVVDSGDFGLVERAGSIVFVLGGSNGLGLGSGLVTRPDSAGFQLADSVDFENTWEESAGLEVADSTGFKDTCVKSTGFQLADSAGFEDTGTVSIGFLDADSATDLAGLETELCRSVEEIASFREVTTWAPVVTSFVIAAPW